MYLENVNMTQVATLLLMAARRQYSAKNALQKIAFIVSILQRTTANGHGRPKLNPSLTSNVSHPNKSML